jgi:hypothetical protein
MNSPLTTARGGRCTLAAFLVQRKRRSSSRTLDNAEWNNSRLVRDVAEIATLKVYQPC